MTQILEVLSGRFWAILSGFSFRTPQSSSPCRDFWPGPSGAGFVSGFAEAPARFEFFHPNFELTACKIAHSGEQVTLHRSPGL